MSETEKKSILIIEGDEAIRNGLSDRFKKRGLSVITASDGYDGYIRATKEIPNFVICETLLPSMNGYRVSRLLKYDDRYKHILFILMTSNTGDKNKSLHQSSGADHLLEKPFRFKDLMALLEDEPKSS